ncbi:MAG TPA: nodulation protein NfeD [Steroidobacteraceae bacterium]|nr:nodulation protein NfeD [Steroidobacteraceae bacterium]
MSEARSGRIVFRHIAQWLAVALLLVGPSSSRSTDAAPTVRFATLIELKGPIGPAMSRYIEQSLADAANQGSTVVILEMDTPGGLDTSMRDIIKAILASPVPIVTYVAPSGARAASAGTYILYASHLAAMAPATNLGAATPISIGGEPSTTPVSPPVSPTGGPSDDKKHDAPEAIPAGNAGERKAINDAVAYIRALAQLRGRNAVWAEAAVRGAASLSANDALEQNVIDVIAKDVPDLLRQLHGRNVKMPGHELALDTRELGLRSVAPDWRTRVLLVLTHPTIAYGLLLIGIYGLLLEGYNPGVVLPGVIGALSLLLGLYGLQLLVVNYAGLALMALGIGLIVAEFFMPAFGSLGVGGLTSFVIGSIMLFDNHESGMRVAMPVIVGIAVAGGLIIVIIGWLAARARRRPLSAGVETMIGANVEVVSDCQDRCVVRYGGELWNARTARPLHAGQQVRVVKVADLTLWVEPQ